MEKEIKERICCVCEKLTSDVHRFTDDIDEDGNPTGYNDFCCDECFENLLDSL